MASRLNFGHLGAAAAMVGGLAMAGPARAEPAWVTFSTWLRVAPGAGAKILSELDSGVRVEREACEGGWCRVVSDRAVGYLPATLLADAPRGQKVPEAAGCFPAQHFTMEGPIPLKVCPAKPAP